MSKGSKSRITDRKAYSRGWSAVFSAAKNETRVCCSGHKYVTTAGEVGVCWCGARAGLSLASGAETDAEKS